MFQGDQRASLSSLSGDLSRIMSRYRISKGRAADARAKRFLEGALPRIGATRLWSWLPGAGCRYSDFQRWFSWLVL